MGLIKALFKLVFIILILAVLVVGGYAAYVFLTYSRIPDKQPLEVVRRASGEAVPGKEYTAVTFNIGFGAYTPEFTFFMDGGTDSRAESKESVVECVGGCGRTALSFNPDLVLFQEVDTDATRSRHVDQAELLRGMFNAEGDYDSVFAQNYHSAYLMVPVTEPHGASESGLLTQSRMPVTEALRRSFPIADGFKKILDLDRCYSILRIPVENGRELVVINAHLSAYGTDAAQGNAQLEMLFKDMEEEYGKGNYVICGADFNHDFTGNSREYFNPGTDKVYSWCNPFPDEIIPEGFYKCTDYTGEPVSTTRFTDIPYSEESFVVTIDGFIVSENVKCTEVRNIDTGYQYTDHNPVVMKFVLQ